MLYKSYLLFISLPTVSLGILSGSQFGSSTICFFSFFGYSWSCWYYFVLLVHSSLLCFLVSGFSLDRGQPGHTVRLVPPLPSTAMFFLLYPSPLFFSSSSVFSDKRCWPKVAIPALPLLFSAVPPMPLVACAAGCLSNNCFLAFLSPPLTGLFTFHAYLLFSFSTFLL